MLGPPSSRLLAVKRKFWNLLAFCTRNSTTNGKEYCWHSYEIKPGPPDASQPVDLHVRLEQSCRKFTKKIFDPGKGSEEHAVLSSLGPESLTQYMLRRMQQQAWRWNRQTVFRRVRVLSTMLGITTGSQPRAAVEHDGLYDLKSGGIQIIESIGLPRRPTWWYAVMYHYRWFWGTSACPIEQVLKTENYWWFPIDWSQVGKVVLANRTQKKTGSRWILQFRAVAKMLLTYLATLVKSWTIAVNHFAPSPPS